MLIFVSKQRATALAALLFALSACGQTATTTEPGADAEADVQTADTAGTDAADTSDTNDVATQDTNQPDATGQAPKVTAIVPADGAVFAAGLPVTLTVTALDADTATAKLLLTVTDDGKPSATWTVVGPDVQSQWTATAVLAAGAHAVTASVKDDGGLTGTLTRNIQVLDAATPKLTFAPAAPTTLDNLTVQVDAGLNAALKLGNATLAYAWTVNGKAVAETSATLQADQFKGGDKVHVQVTLTAATLPGWSTSLGGDVTILHAPPDIPAVLFDVATPTIADTITCKATATDADNLPLTYSYTWSLNGTPIPGQTAPTLVLASADSGHWVANVPAHAGDSLACIVLASDGTVTSDPGTALTVLGGFDPCATEQSGCDAYATCSKGVTATATCTCSAGFTGDGFSCVNLNECATPTTNDCAADATCEDTMGSFLCDCKSGFDGDGKTCVALPNCAPTMVSLLDDVNTASEQKAGITISDTPKLSGTAAQGLKVTSFSMPHFEFPAPVTELSVLVGTPVGTAYPVEVLVNQAYDVNGAVVSPIYTTVGSSTYDAASGMNVTTQSYGFATPITKMSLGALIMDPGGWATLQAVGTGTTVLHQIDFTALNNGQCADSTDACAISTSAYIGQGVTISGSGNVYILPGQGLGVLGGYDNAYTDGDEWVDFEFAKPINKLVLQANAKTPSDPYFELINALSITVATYTTQPFNAVHLFPDAQTLLWYANQTTLSVEAGQRLGSLVWGRCKP